MIRFHTAIRYVGLGVVLLALVRADKAINAYIKGFEKEMNFSDIKVECVSNKDNVWWQATSAVYPKIRGWGRTPEEAFLNLDKHIDFKRKFPIR